MKEKYRQIKESIINIKREDYPILYILINSYLHFRNPNIRYLPAQISFYLVLSILPLIMAFLQGVILFKVDDSLIILEFFEEITGLDPVYMAEGINRTSFFSYIYFYIVILWLSSKGYYSINHSTNIVYNMKAKHKTFRSRINAFFMTIIMVTIISFLLVILVLSTKIISALPIFNLYETYKLPIEFLNGLISMFVVFLFIYFLQSTTNKSSVTEFKPHIYGVIISSFGWLISSIGFKIYVNVFANYNNIYGSLSTTVILLLWVYLLSFSLVFGICVNYVIDRDEIISKK